MKGPAPPVQRSSLKGTPPATNITGSWDVTVGGNDEQWVGFMCFYPDGTAFMSYYSGWTARAWKYEIVGNAITGNIMEQGQWTCSVDENGTTGTGRLGPFPFEMNRRSKFYANASEYAVGEWQLWTRELQEATVRLNIVEVTESHESKAADATVFCVRSETIYLNAPDTVHEAELTGIGHSLSGSTKIGKVNIQFSEDGTLVLAQIGPTQLEGWRMYA